MPPSPESPQTDAERLQALRDRLHATQEAAQRLAAEARADRPPAAGWDVPRRGEEAHAELDALVALLRTLRGVVPPELQAQLAELARQILVFVRAVLDWWIARLDRPPATEPEVEDIPIA
jgi:hypothetical protein